MNNLGDFFRSRRIERGLSHPQNQCFPAQEHAHDMSALRTRFDPPDRVLHLVRSSERGYSLE
jgi:hypothetical protein